MLSYETERVICWMKSPKLMPPMARSLRIQPGLAQKAMDRTRMPTSPEHITEKKGEKQNRMCEKLSIK
jgi:hypothetical protein